MRHHTVFTRGRRLGGVAVLGLLLAACGSDNNDSVISGTAATGNPVVGGSVTLSCKNNGSAAATTNSQGKWSTTVPATSLPCVIKVSGGTVGGSANADLFFSITTTSGNTVIANVSPLTSLALARITGAPLDAPWFAGLNESGRQQLAAGIDAAITGLLTALNGYALPDGFNPFAVAFTAGGSDAYDVLLEQLKQSILNANTTYSALLAAFAGGGDLPAPAAIVEEPDTSCSTTGADDKLGFTNAPADFCVFNKEASANTIDNYYQFTATAGSNGTTYVKFNMDGDTVLNVMIENNKYAFGCGVGTQPACTGVTFTSSSNYQQFSMTNTVLAAITGTTQALTVNGLLIHSTSGGGTGGSDTIATPALDAGEFGVRFASNGTINSTPENGVERFFNYTGNGGITTGSGDSAGLLDEAYIVISSPFSSFGLRYLPNTPGTYDCGYALGSLNPRNIELAYAVGQGYSSIGTHSVSGFSCSITVTHAGTISGSSYSGYTEGTFKARLFKTGAPVNLANSIVVSGTFRLGN